MEMKTRKKNVKSWKKEWKIVRKRNEGKKEKLEFVDFYFHCTQCIDIDTHTHTTTFCPHCVYSSTKKLSDRVIYTG